MNKKLVAKELLRIARLLVATVEKGGPYKVNMNIVKKDMGDTPHLKLLMKEIKQGKGTVDVDEVDGDYAEVYATGTYNHLIGTIKVPVSALTKA